jgi:SPP1 gp7 family putative phage head morphogenesis protein
MPQPVELGLAFGLEPAAAVEYFRGKGYAITFNWEAMAAEAHARAFTVAKVMRMDVLEAIRGEVDRAIAKGTTFKQFRDGLEPRLKALGFWGQQVVERPDGSGQMVNVTAPHRLETIFRTNVQSAYMAGRHRAFMDNVDDRPYWQYLTAGDDKVRPAHAALANRVFRYDDPIWRSCWPPNGYRCRCRVRALSARDLKAKGLSVSESGEDLQSFEDVDPQTGQVFERVAYKGPGMEFPFAPDRGFVGNQALAAAAPELAVASKAPRVLGPGADRALAEIPRANWPAWNAWLDDVFAAGRPRGASRVVGYAQQAERAFLEKEGIAFSSGALEIEDRLVIGRKVARYEAGQRALGDGDWRGLPFALSDSRAAVLFHRANGTLVYLLGGAGDRSLLRLIVRPGTQGRRRDPHDAIRSASWVSRDDMLGSLSGGHYELISGKL